MKSLINFYDGKIIHQRLGKTKHKFTNLHLFLLINISKITSSNFPSICSNFLFLSINKFNILSWHVKDHGNRKNEKIEDLNEYVIKMSKIKKFDDIYLLCFPRILNFGFNPISIYFFSYNNKITHTIYEVKNTFGDIHHYITNNKISKNKFHKKMFVSPFFKNDGHYEILSKIRKKSVFVNSAAHVDADFCKAFFRRIPAVVVVRGRTGSEASAGPKSISALYFSDRS